MSMCAPLCHSMPAACEGSNEISIGSQRCRARLCTRHKSHVISCVLYPFFTTSSRSPCYLLTIFTTSNTQQRCSCHDQLAIRDTDSKPPQCTVVVCNGAKGFTGESASARKREQDLQDRARARARESARASERASERDYWRQ